MPYRGALQVFGAQQHDSDAQAKRVGRDPAGERIECIRKAV